MHVLSPQINLNLDSNTQEVFAEIPTSRAIVISFPHSIAPLLPANGSQKGMCSESPN